jgi:lipoprotein-anchoring transpeptidase ErfK/SrfK
VKNFARLVVLSVVLAGLVLSDGWTAPSTVAAGTSRTSAAELARERQVAALVLLAQTKDIDVRQKAEQLEKVMAQATKLGISLDPAGPADATAGWYATASDEQQVAMHDSLANDLTSALVALQSRVAAKQRALNLASQARDLLGQAEWQGTQQPGDEAAVSSASAVAKKAADDADLAAAIQQLQPLVARLAKEANSEPTLPLPNGPCLTGAPPKLIWVHLATQELIAYQNGCPILATLVTTGRPALPTGRGVFHIFYKARWYLMHSPWPYSSPYWYPDTWVGYAMEFIGDGTFIHTADWEPPAAYGKGSEYGSYASHGCVHVMDGPAAQLFAWAPIGTEVIVGD